jgi:predicted RNase H-like HicB family nuclease
MGKRFKVIIEKDSDGYYAYVPALAGCQTQGDTIDEVTANIREAMELYIATLGKTELKSLSDAVV